MVFVIILAVFAFMLLIVAAKSVRIVRPYQLGLVERLGRFKEQVDPGLRIILPFVDRLILVDMREQVVDVPPQEVITSDNVVVSVDAVVYYEATDPQRLAYNIANFQVAVTKLAQTNLRNVIGDMELDGALTSRDTINTLLREVLDDATDKWGVRIVRVEIQRIDPPPDVVNAMHNQMKAERERRAAVTEAEGIKAAQVTTAEGEKQSAILAAQGNKEQQILNAQGAAEATERLADAHRYERIALAEGEAAGIRSVFAAIHDGRPTRDVIALKYLEALQGIADGRATKIFLPNEMEGIFGMIGGLAEMLRDDDGTDAPAIGSADGS